MKQKYIQYTQCGAAITRSIISTSLTISPHSSPLRARYGVSVVNANSDWCFVSITIVLCAIYCCTGPRYDGTRLYIRTIVPSGENLLKSANPISCLDDSMCCKPYKTSFYRRLVNVIMDWNIMGTLCLVKIDLIIEGVVFYIVLIVPGQYSVRLSVHNHIYILITGS